MHFMNFFQKISKKNVHLMNGKTIEIIKFATKFKFIINYYLSPLECKRIKYDLTMTFSNYPSNQYYEYLKNNSVILKHFKNNLTSITYDKLKSRILALNIYYDQLSYTKISEYPHTEIVELISNIGYIFSLFLGLSLLSFCELFQLIVNIFHEIFRKFLVEKI